MKYVFASNGHRYGEVDLLTQLQSGPFAFADFPAHPDLTARYAKDTGVDLNQSQAAMLFQADSPACARTCCTALIRLALLVTVLPASENGTVTAANSVG